LFYISRSYQGIDSLEKTGSGSDAGPLPDLSDTTKLRASAGENAHGRSQQQRDHAEKRNQR